MAEFTITIPAELLNGLLDAFESAYPIPVDEDEIPLHTKAVWARMKVRQYVREIYRSQAAVLAAEAARISAADTAEVESEGLTVD